MKIQKRLALFSGAVVMISSLAIVPAQATQTVNGVEDSIVDITPVKSPSIISFTYTGEGVFSASPVDATGKEGLPYQLQIGDFSGSYFQKTPTKPIVALAVKGTGEWTITISPLKSAPMMSSKSGNGNGTQVVGIGKATSGIKRITWSHAGDGVFAVTPIDGKGKSRFPLFLKIGNYNGTVMLPSGTQYFEIKADGAWTYSIK